MKNVKCVSTFLANESKHSQLIWFISIRTMYIRKTIIFSDWSYVKNCVLV